MKTIYKLTFVYLISLLVASKVIEKPFDNADLSMIQIAVYETPGWYMMSPYKMSIYVVKLGKGTNNKLDLEEMSRVECDGSDELVDIKYSIVTPRKVLLKYEFEIKYSSYYDFKEFMEENRQELKKKDEIEALKGLLRNVKAVGFLKRSYLKVDTSSKIHEKQRVAGSMVYVPFEVLSGTVLMGSYHIELDLGRDSKGSESRVKLFTVAEDQETEINGKDTKKSVKVKGIEYTDILEELVKNIDL